MMAPIGGFGLKKRNFEGFFQGEEYNKPFLDLNGQNCGIILTDKFTSHLRRGKCYSKVTRKCLRYPVDWEVKTCNGHPVTQTFLLDVSAMGARIEGPQHPCTNSDMLNLLT